MKKPNAKFCADCPAIQNDEWRARGAVIRIHLRRHDLTYRERQLAELILDKTYGWQRSEIIIPALQFFTDLTGIDTKNVTKVLKSLHGRRVIRIRTEKGQHVYSLNPDSESWKAMPRLTTSGMQTAMNLLREINGMAPISAEYEAAQNFKGAIAAAPRRRGVNLTPVESAVKTSVEPDLAMPWEEKL